MLAGMSGLADCQDRREIPDYCQLASHACPEMAGIVFAAQACFLPGAVGRLSIFAKSSSCFHS
jgi:hypothetical protein